MKQLLIPIIAFLLSVNVYSQRPDKEKVKALKIAHITEQLDLTTNEAQAFWPVYNAHEERLEKLKIKSEERRKDKNPDDLTESEAKSLLLEMISMEKQKNELNEKFLNSLLKILPAKKIIELHRANVSFRKKLIEEFKERHRDARMERRKQ